MGKSYFEFKKFVIYHDKCGMKVGTDGVLLGAWFSGTENAQRILDIGCGSGLIAIMAAQRTNSAEIYGVDIDENAIIQSTENGMRTPWKDRLHFIKSDICSFQTDQSFDIIVSNPPFFVSSLNSLDKRRNLARHNDTLPFEALVETAVRLLGNNGRMQVILPYESGDDFIQLAWGRGLQLFRKCLVFSKEGERPIRMMIDLLKGSCTYPMADKLYIRNTMNEYNEQYKALTKDYYLHF